MLDQSTNEEVNNSTDVNFENDFFSTLQEKNRKLLATSSFPSRKHESWRKVKLEEWDLAPYNRSEKSFNNKNSSNDASLLNSSPSLPKDYLLVNYYLGRDKSTSLEDEHLVEEQVFLGTLTEYLSYSKSRASTSSVNDFDISSRNEETLLNFD